MMAILTGVRWYFIIVLICIYLIISSAELFFLASVGHVYRHAGDILWRNVYLDLMSIFWLGCLVFLILICMSCLYILEINPLSFPSFANILSHSVGCLFILFMVSSAVQELLSLLSKWLYYPRQSTDSVPSLSNYQRHFLQL